MKQKNLLICLMGFFLSYTTANASESPVTIQSISAHGNACPEGSVAITIAPDQRSFTVLFDQAVVESSIHSRIQQKTCSLTIVSHVPAGWLFNIHSNDTRGFSQVEKGSSAFHRTSYYQLTSEKRWLLIDRTFSNFKPTTNDNFLIHHKTRTLQPSRLRCKDHLETITVQIQVGALSLTRKPTSAQVALDSFDGTVEGSRHICH
jgi:hypothetical protein